MSAIEHLFQIDIVAIDADGTSHVLAWEHTDPESNERHEAGYYRATALGDARHVWRQLNVGDRPKDLVGLLSGWAGMTISPVQILRRFHRRDGWSPWEPDPANPYAEGTHAIHTGTFAARASFNPRGMTLAEIVARRADLLGIPTEDVG